jgi:carbon-monoxide dehydrogenase medium subunit
MIPRFSLTRARELGEAFEAVTAGDGEVAYLAGGTELLQVMKMGLAQFAGLIDIKSIAELNGIGVDGSLLRIGAATTHRQLERSDLVARHLPALVSLEGRVANVRVRNQGTIGGNLAFAEPHSDPVTLLLAFGARLQLASPGGTRTLPVGDFVLGPLFTAREPDEILTAIEIDLPGRDEAAAYEKLAFFERPAVSVAVRLKVADRRVADATVAIGAIGEVPQLAAEAAASLTGAGDDDELEAALEVARGHLESFDATPDLNGSADYKRHLAGVLLARAVHTAYTDAIHRA